MRKLLRDLLGLKKNEKATRGEVVAMIGVGLTFLLSIGAGLLMVGMLLFFLASEHTVGFVIFLLVVALVVGGIELLVRAINKGLADE
jgi:undecaprenyl pyrophosphate phosphatase UppP